MSDSPAVHAGAGRRYSLRINLILVVLACALPSAIIIAWLVADGVRLKRESLENRTTLLARRTLTDLEREFDAIESGLKVLATSSDVVSGDFRSFHQRAKDALPSGTVRNYVLTDAQNTQLVNTLVPYGQPLPQGGTPPALLAVTAQGVTVLTDLFTGPVSRRPTIAMGVPVHVGGRIAYSLNIGMGPDRINQLIARQPLPEGWLVAVLDGSGTIAGRSRDADTFVGQKAVSNLIEATRREAEGRLHTITKEGIPALTAYAKSKQWGWTVAVGVPEAELQADLRQQVGMGMLGILLAFGLGIGLALRLTRQVLVSIDQLSYQALALVRGDPVEPPPLLIVEAEVISLALQRAATVMGHVRFQAEHDNLTGLGNRAYLDGSAQRMLSLAQRLSLPVAVLMLDLDGFKDVNDTHGHLVGDDVLRQAAQRILSVIRTEDVVARLGGDEFCILINNADHASADQTAARLMQALSAPYTGVAPKVSVSVGAALFPEAGQDLPTLLAQADQALYRAKAAGKNCVVFAPAQAAAATGSRK